MKTIITFSFLAIATATYGQDVLCARGVVHMCGYERIFMTSGGNFTEGRKTLDDIAGTPALSLDSTHEAMFQNDSNERTNDWSRVLLQSMDTLITIKSPEQSILPDYEIRNLLRQCSVIPKSVWLHGRSIHADEPRRYVVSCFVETIGDITIDIHPGGFAVVFYEDGTYSCLADLSHSCIKQPQQGGPGYPPQGVGSPDP